MKYYFNQIADKHGYHEVHSEDCIFFPIQNGKRIDGEFLCCADAIKAAKIQHPSLTFCHGVNPFRLKFLPPAQIPNN